MRVYVVQTGYGTILEVTDSLTGAMRAIRLFLEQDDSIDHAKVLSHSSPPVGFKFVLEWRVVVRIFHDKREAVSERRVFRISSTKVKASHELG